jgi:hypothetical protein
MQVAVAASRRAIVVLVVGAVLASSMPLAATIRAMTASRSGSPWNDMSPATLSAGPAADNKPRRDFDYHLGWLVQVSRAW